MPEIARLWGIEQLEPRTLMTRNPLAASALPDIPDVGGQNAWALNVINAPEAWARGFSGQDVVVAVIDTGVDAQHPDLRGNIWRNPGEIAGNGRDDDRNGFVDDVAGWDFVDGDNTPQDERGHGTHVAGTIAAHRNRYGGTGVAPDARIMPLRVLDENGGGSSANIEASIYYAVDNGADVINLSLGGSGTRRFELALRYAEERNVLVVAAAGNDGDASPGFPARYSETISNVISVGAYDRSFTLLASSNRVGNTNAVQVDAPGIGIFSTSPGGQYTARSGTSTATPIVSGVAALALSANPNLAAANLREMLVFGANTSVAGSDSVGGINAATTVAYAEAIGNKNNADINADGVVGFHDFIVLANNFGHTSARRSDGDLDGDGGVRFSDFLVLARSFGTKLSALAAPANDSARFDELDELFAADEMVDALFE